MLNLKNIKISTLLKDFKNNKLTINKNYQRNYVWKKNQSNRLLESILGDFPIGLFVVWKKQLLDGQQRLKTLQKFNDNQIEDSLGRKFDKLSLNEKKQFRKYEIPILYISNSATDEFVARTFVRLQEGERLRTSEKVFAFVSKYRDAFMDLYMQNQKFFNLVPDNRYQSKFLAATILKIELDLFKNKKLPSLRYVDFWTTNEEFQKKLIPPHILKTCNKNLEFLLNLEGLIGVLQKGELLSLYLLVAELNRRNGLKHVNVVEFVDFAYEFAHNLEIIKPLERKPKHLSKKVFTNYIQYKIYAKQLTNSASLEGRLICIIKDFERIVGPIKQLDKKRFYTKDDKKIMFIKQKGLCPGCNKRMKYPESAHHVVPHSKGGKTVLSNGVLLHERCHAKLEKNKPKTTIAKPIQNM